MHKVKTGVDLIKEERERQIEKFGYNSNHDGMYHDFELVRAAIAYLQSTIADCAASVPEVYPFPNESFKYEGHKRNLEKAGALIAAELDRICFSKNQSVYESEN